MTKRVHVVMRNDFPDRVYADERAAEAYCALKRAENEKAMEADPGRVRIHWRAYAFDLIEAP